MTLVVKLGGNAIAGAGLRAIAGDLARLATSGRVVVVHGGGPQVSDLQRKLGQEPRKVAGRRVTDEATLDVLKMVVGGKLNVDVCAALLAAGASPVGLHGASACVIEAERRPPRVLGGAGAEPVDLGLVGDVIAVNRAFLEGLCDAGHLPVLACIGAGRDGAVYNINADVVASRIAVDLGAAALVLVSDTPGVLRDVRDPATRIPVIRQHDEARLLADGVVTEGMIPKLEEGFAAIRAGVQKLHIVGGLGPGDLERELADPGSVGTALLP
jgi:acetylglutamate kinase